VLFKESNPMRIAIYTSLAINYLAKARVLASTVKAINPNIDVIAIVCDRFPPGIDPTLEPFDEVWMVEEYPFKPVKAWIFQHTIMELCTAVKGWALQRLLARGYDYVMYLDPDCWVREDPAQLVRILAKDKSVAVVPHTTSPAKTKEEIRLIETSSLKHGIYNLGFLLVKNDDNGRIFARWWADRLHDFCFIEFEKGIFTDQRWFDLGVGYFPFIQVSWHKGIDVASWNIGQRKIERSKSGGYLIDGDPLIFYHFSGVGPAGVHRWVRDIFAPSDPLAAELEFDYEALLNAAGQKKLAVVRSAYDKFDDGAVVAPAERVRFRELENGIRQFPNPYAATAEASFRIASDQHTADSKKSVREFSDTEIEGRACRIFDHAFYRTYVHMPDADFQTSWNHYKSRRWAHESKPNAFFDPAYYAISIAKNEREKYVTPLHHYIARGLALGIAPAWFFDEAYYLKIYPDVEAAVRIGNLVSGFEHFLIQGKLEGRSSSAFFDEINYLKSNPDVANAVSAGSILSGSEHYISSGYREPRKGVGPSFLE
jgi:hypothetical protein